MKEQIELKVYYDSLCKVCDAEIQHYKRQQGSEKIEFVDICSGQFDAKQEGLDPAKVHKIMHAKRKDGTLATRVDAFIEIWKVLPRYHWLAKLSSLAAVKAGLEIGYSGFTIIRPMLPRYKNLDCSDSPYCEIKKA